MGIILKLGCKKYFLSAFHSRIKNHKKKQTSTFMNNPMGLKSAFHITCWAVNDIENKSTFTILPKVKTRCNGKQFQWQTELKIMVTSEREKRFPEHSAPVCDHHVNGMELRKEFQNNRLLNLNECLDDNWPSLFHIYARSSMSR